MRDRFLVPLFAALAIAACARPQRAQDAYAAAVADAIPIVEKTTGLTYKKPPVYKLRTRAEIHDFLEKLFNEEKPARDLAEQQTILRRLGVIPDTLDLRKLELDLLTEQIVGLYDPRSKVLYIVKGTDPAIMALTVQHELVHALQDQYMNLDSVENLKGDDDRSLAAAAVIEGQATLVTLEAANAAALEMPGMWDRARDAIRESASSTPVMSRTPRFLQEILVFPYLSGAEFVHTFQKERPGKMPYNAALPASSSQIMHSREYFGTPREEPITVTLPAPSTGALEYDNVMGEFSTKVILYELLKDQRQASDAAAGWSGDRYALVKTAQGEGLAWLMLFRSAVDAAEFAQAMEGFAQVRYPNAKTTKSGVTTTMTAAGRTVTIWGGTVAGHAAVLFQDVPSGAPASLFDLAKVRLDQRGSE
jgi:hypothetical protein